MVNVTDDVKAVYGDGKSHLYDLKVYVGSTPYFDKENAELTVGLENIKAESLDLTERLTNDRFKFGTIATSVLKLTLINRFNILDRYIIVEISYDEKVVPLGRFFVAEWFSSNESEYSTMTAYDYTYFLKKEASLTGIKSTTNMIQLAALINTQTGVRFKDGWSDKLFNTSVGDLVASTSKHRVSLTCADILSFMAEINAGWFKADRNGYLDLKQISNLDTVIINNPVKDTAELLGYGTNYYNAIQLSVYGVNYSYKGPGTTGNIPYILTSDNILLDGLNGTQMYNMMLNLYNHIKTFWYYPIRAEFEALPYLEAGDRIGIMFKTGPGEYTARFTYILNQHFVGIGGMMQSVEARAETASVQSESDKIARLISLVNDLSNK